jgi:uncharacterized membrane protein YhaH (DUF805 family)
MTAMTGDIADYGRDYHEQVGMTEAFKRAFSNYATFDGRANRGEYWWFVLASALINLSAQAADWTFFVSVDGGFPVLSVAWALVSFLPALGLTIRRLHDIDRSGWSMLIALIPIVGPFIAIFRMCKQGEPRANRFG